MQQGFQESMEFLLQNKSAITSPPNPIQITPTASTSIQQSWVTAPS
jgi:hypothetical protein